MHPLCKLSKAMSPKSDAEIAEMAEIPYRTVIGMLLYLMVSSRPDIAYAVCTCARFMDCPGKEHWYAVCTILKYLKGTTDLRITYSATKNSAIPILNGYCDADWATNGVIRTLDMYSIFPMVLLLGSHVCKPVSHYHLWILNIMLWVMLQKKLWNCAKYITK